MIEAIRLRAAQMWRTHRERVAEKKAAKLAESHIAASQLHGHTTRFFLLHLPATATILAAFVEVYWAILFCIEATGRVDSNLDYSAGTATATAFSWDFAFAAHVPVLLGLMAATVPIIIYSMVWLPMQFALRGSGLWKRGTLIAVGLAANLLVIVSGTVVMNSNRQDHVREALVTEQRGDAGRAALVARHAAIKARWDTLTEGTTLQAQAARAGVAGWDAYIATARQQAAAGTISAARLALIERARGSAVAAEAYQHQMDDMTGQIAAAAPAAATAAHVEDTTGAPLDQFAQQVGVWRPVFVAIICSAIGVLSSWWVLAMLEGMNPRDVLRSGWADEAHRIEDKRDEPKGEVQPMVPPRQRRKVYNAETGEEETFVQGHFRKTGKKKKRADGTMAEEMEYVPPRPEDEKAAVAVDGGDDGLRSAGVVSHEVDQFADGALDASQRPPSVDAVKDDEQQDGAHHESEEQTANDNPVDHSEPSESEDDLAAFMVDDAPQTDVSSEQPETEPNSEPGEAVAASEADDAEPYNDAEIGQDTQEDTLHDDDLPVAPRALLPAAASAAAE